MTTDGLTKGEEAEDVQERTQALNPGGHRLTGGQSRRSSSVSS